MQARQQAFKKMYEFILFKNASDAMLSCCSFLHFYISSSSNCVTSQGYPKYQAFRPPEREEGRGEGV